MLLTFILTLSHSFSLSHSFNLSFNHSRHAEQFLFSCLGSKVTVYCRKLQCFFFDSHSLLTTLPCEFGSHRAGSQLKMSECQTKAGNLECMNVWMFWTTFVFMSMLKTYSHTFSLSLCLTLTLSHSRTLSISHSITIDMLNRVSKNLKSSASAVFLTKFSAKKISQNLHPLAPRKCLSPRICATLKQHWANLKKNLPKFWYLHYF